ncbi:uncharacterized protein METZ01_LOCUS342106 [marine metagenome]|jgi:hypothetical protein|uniref:Uncharacterized protein n=1 Tax=marine metagenome TaxID=408172 RepID=A0A382QWM0_9ZZZZ
MIVAKKQEFSPNNYNKEASIGLYESEALLGKSC